ncbi:MAG: hypothetical protein M0P91_04685 [Sulfuricurvum sp.]|jgi:hypothetical protein|uniref:hypothetical protein n=1 Tax=Sulfuricurvum sp. TaxID=2025608 RepID=UPI0025CDCB1A|nr:hypothetical protein [Sulfuricurvum sp.]MCK9372472.1 hypothetical protein [Sulfuricurvum sp.]
MVLIQREETSYIHIKNAKEIKTSESLFFLSNVKRELEEMKTKLEKFVFMKEVYKKDVAEFWWKQFSTKESIEIQKKHFDILNVYEEYKFVKCEIKITYMADISLDEFKTNQEIIINGKNVNLISIKKLLREISSLLKLKLLKLIDAQSDVYFKEGKDFITQRKLNFLYALLVEESLSKDEFEKEKKKLFNDYIIRLEVDKFDELSEREKEYALKSFKERENQFIANFLNYKQIKDEIEEKEII